MSNDAKEVPVRTKDASFLTGYSEYQIRQRTRYLSEFGVSICERITTSRRFDDYSVVGVRILRRCNFEEQYSRLPPKVAARKAANWWKDKVDCLSIPASCAASMGSIRMLVWILLFEGWPPHSRHQL